MSSSAFFQILYQHETLFQLPEDIVAAPVEAKPALAEVSAKTLPEPQAKTPVPEVSAPVVAEPKTVLPATPVVPPPAAPDFPKLKHKVLILIDEQKQKDMLASEALFLDNILKAVGHSTEHADILNFSFLPGQDARKVFSEKRTNFFITFGVPLIRLHLDLLLAPYTPKNIDGIWFLLADPLVVIEADRNLKKKLWQALKQMFEMS
ncbi:hypothetical protein DYBT9623_03001 [Dyadobacter sp. CECT 9623]|uniref:Uncharacterized protein n=1 Tax=Dyadobacter linearis TaxID=2823330 RepID=A0ABM8URZ6_9BACT|nr:hypothetical protein [Dyadobacter sp. CECT 9623]CAG5070455.1 hypothetical protein DYBT9623_03001 [Dyadobacter sp. CECT 9623]